MHTTIMRSWMFNVYLNALYAMWNPICLIGRRCNWLIDGTRFGIVYKCAYHLQICSKIWMHAIKRFQFVANAGYDTLFCTIVRCTYHVRSVEFDCYEQRLCEQWVLGAPYVHDARWHAARIYTHESRTCNTKYPSTHPYMYKAHATISTMNVNLFCFFSLSSTLRLATISYCSPRNSKTHTAQHPTPSEYTSFICLLYLVRIEYGEK